MSSNYPVLLKTERITKTYRMGKIEVKALRGISLGIEKDEYVAIMGPSGSGKSTLMHILGCLDTPTTGHYYFRGEDVSRLSNGELSQIRNKEFGFVFQSFNLLPRLTAFQNVELPLIYSGHSVSARTKRVTQTLQKVSLYQRKEHKTNELSGGESQRVAIARALVNNPSVLLADEPTGNLDSQTGRDIMMIFNHLAQEGHTIIIVTHDITVANHAKRIIHLKDGKIKDLNSSITQVQ